MLRRVRGYLEARAEDDAPPASADLQSRGYTLLEGVFTPDEVTALAEEITDVYDKFPADRRNPHLSDDELEDFRYEMLNRSPLSQAALAHPRILETIEPLLGEDCHVISNTCWRNPPRESNQHGGGFWHIDAGPHVPRPPGTDWPDEIPYPVFAIGAHIYLQDCPLECGPTGVIPFSHKSGQHPPLERSQDDDLTLGGHGMVPLIAKAGDVAMFVSDVWHRRMRSLPGDSGRFFLQVHYGRRDIAQRIRTTAEVNHLDPDTISRAEDERRRKLIGLHPPFFYDG